MSNQGLTIDIAIDDTEGISKIYQVHDLRSYESAVLWSVNASCTAAMPQKGRTCRANEVDAQTVNTALVVQ